MSRAPASLVVVLAVSVSGGCGTEVPEPASTATLSISASPTPSPTSSPTPEATPEPTASSGPDQDMSTPPTRPAAFNGPATEENAKEVGRYFLTLFPYAVATGDLGAWNELSGTDCTYCQSVRELVAGIHDPGNHGTGGAYELGFAGVSALGGDRFVVGIEYVETPSRTVAPDGSIVEDFPDTYSMQAQIELSWSDGKWTVDGVQVDEWGDNG